MLICQAWAQTVLDRFELALDERRYTAAGRLLEQLPEGPEKILAGAELALDSQNDQESYRLLDGFDATHLSPRLQAKHHLILARHEEAADRFGTHRNGHLERLLREGLTGQASPHDRAELLLMQLQLAREDRARAEGIVKELFEVSPSAGFRGRIRLLQAADQTEELLALEGTLEEQARANGQLALAGEYRLHSALLRLQTGHGEAAVASLSDLLEETLKGQETAPVPNILTYLHWALQSSGREGPGREVFEDAAKRLGPGDVAMRTLSLATRAFPEEEKYARQGAAMAKSLGRPLVAASFLFALAERESDQQRAKLDRQEARELLRGRDLRGVGNTWFGYALANGLPAAGLDTDDDREVWGRYQAALGSGRTEGQISELWSALMGSAPDRQAAWIWVEPLFESIVEQTADWPKRERASRLVDALQRLRRSWVTTTRMGQATTFAPREGILAAALGARVAARPDLVEEILEGLAEEDRADTDPGRLADKLSTLGQFLAAQGRCQEAADLFGAAAASADDRALIRLRLQAALAGAERALDMPSASDRYAELAGTDFQKDLGPYDQPWRRATELAWLNLEEGQPLVAERCARAALQAIPRGWSATRARRLGAHEALAFALDGQGRQSELDTLLEQWRQEQGADGERWLAILKAELLLGAGHADQAALILPKKPQDEDDASRIYLADLRRRIAMATGNKEEVARMESGIRDGFERIAADSAYLRRALLASPAYRDLRFLRGHATVATPDNAVFGDADRLEKISERLERLRRREPDNVALAQLGVARVRAMAQACGPDEVVVQPVLLSHSILLVVASNSQAGVWERFVDVQAVHQTVRRLSLLAADPSTMLERMEDDGDYLSERLLEPWRARFPNRKHLLWLAQGELKSLPLPLLRLDGHSLLESMTVTYLDGPAGAPAFAMEPSRSALLIGGSDDLEGATQELLEVRKLLPKGESWRLGQDFAELQGMARRHSLIHIASHGLPPSKSRMGGELSGTEGSLSAFRLADLDFARGSLVVASACQVGSETSGPGDSTVLNALRTAGAATVIGSPWPVDDEASIQLVVAFYGHLLQGEDPSSALAHAQLEVRTSHPHPFYWAGARVLTGPSRRPGDAPPGG
jgi:CHAT domain-containing protein